VVLVSAALLCQLREPLSRLSLQAAAVCSLLLIMAITAFTSAGAAWLYPQADTGAGPGWWVLRNTLIAAVLGGILLRHFHLQQQLRAREKSEIQARLDSLRARIRPHFLFNTLNSIASLVVSQPAAAEQAVEDLSELFRDSLQENAGDTTVAKEIHRCELYLDIERLRLGQRLRVDWSVDPAARPCFMPSLILQPLVENAVYHGVAQLAEGGTISIAVDREASRIRASVENPVPRRPRESRGQQIAQVSIRQLLSAHFGERAEMTIDAGPERYRVQLDYPVEAVS
jgi:two-component system sensor histidine kinase AlgZ